MNILNGGDYKVTGQSSDFGIPFTELAGPGNVSLRLTEQGLQQLDNPYFAELLDSTVSTIARHDAMHEPSVAGVDPSRVLKVASPNEGDRNMSSVYADGQTIIKAGLDRNEGWIQFSVMNWLDVRLQENGSSIQAPTQLAHIESATGRPTTLMQQVKGQQLQTALHPLTGLVPREDRQEIHNNTIRTIHGEVVAAIGARATRVFINDMYQHGHVGNILVDGTPGSQDARYSIIDQPSFTTAKDRLILPLRFKQLRGKSNP